MMNSPTEDTPNQAALPSGPDLLEPSPAILGSVVVEFASRCNLRCVYCHQNKPEFQATPDVTEEVFEQVRRFVAEGQVAIVNVTGGGESLELPDWQEKAERLLALGTQLHLTTNLARLMTPSEHDTLSRFNHITVSIDTVDRELLRSIRKSVDVRTILYNLLGIRAAALSAGRRCPTIRLSCVLSVEVLGGVGDLAGFAAALRADEFMFQDLVEYNGISNNLHSVWTLTGETAVEASRGIRRAIAILGANRVRYLDPTGIEEKLRIAEGGGSQTMEYWDGPQGRMFSAAPGPGETRDCLDPWTFMQVLADGQVRACCISRVYLGTVSETTPLAAIHHGETARRLRQELLTGALDEYCRACSFRGVTSVEALNTKVTALVGSDGTQR